MDAFSYLSVLLSIIIGLAIAEVLQGYRGLLLARGKVRRDATPLIWSVLLLFAAVQAWWASFGLRDHEDWSFLTFTVILIQVGLLYMAAAVILPGPGEDDRIDLAGHFERQRTAFFGFLLAMLAVSIVKDLLLDGELPDPMNLMFHGVLGGLAVVGMVVSPRRVQLGIALIAAIGFAAYIAILFARL